MSHTPRQEAGAFYRNFGLGVPGGSRAVLLHTALLGVFGVWLPWRKGLDFFDPAMISAYACLSVVFAAPAAAQAFANDPPRSRSQAMARLFAVVLYGETMTLAMLFGGVVTVNATHLDATHGARLLFPELDTLAFSLALGIAAAGALSTAAAWVALRFSLAAARGGLRVAFLILLGGFFLAPRRLPEVAGRAAVLFLALAAVLIPALWRAVASHRPNDSPELRS